MLKEAKLRWLIMALVFIMVALPLAACSGDNANNEAGNTPIETNSNETNFTDANKDSEANDKAAEEPVNDDPVELTIFANNQGVNFDNTPGIQYIEEKTNTKLTILSASTAEMDNQLNVLLASGEELDIIQYGDDQMEMKLVEAGMLLKLNDLIEKYPNVKNFRDEGQWDIMRHADGSIYSIGAVTHKANSGYFYRQDWLEALNLEVPETIEEYYKVADAMANNDPDDNGVKDTWAFGGNGTLADGQAKNDHIFSAYGVLPNYWQLKDGEVINGSVAEGAKDALIMMNRLYENGMIDPEFITDSTERYREKYVSGIFGTPSEWSRLQGANNSLDGVYIAGPQLKGPDGTHSGTRMNPQRGWVKTAIMADSEKADAAMRLLDWLASEEGNHYTSFGVEGVHHEVEDNGMVVNIGEAAPRNEYGHRLYLMRDASPLKHFQPYMKEIVATGSSWAEPNPADGLLIPELDKYEVDLNEYTEAEFLKMIVGEVEIEGGYERFKEEWFKRGGQELTNALNAEYQRRQ